MTKRDLLTTLDAFGAAKASGNERLIKWSFHELKAVIDTLPESWGENETTDQPQPAAQPTESES